MKFKKTFTPCKIGTMELKNRLIVPAMETEYSKHRRKIFKIQGVEDKVKEIITDTCKELDIEIIAMECHIDHVHLFLNTLPSISPSDIMHRIKGASSRLIRKEFLQLSKMPSLWTRSYFVSTAGNVSSETVKKYVDEQKTR